MFVSNVNYKLIFYKTEKNNKKINKINLQHILQFNNQLIINSKISQISLNKQKKKKKEETPVYYLNLFRIDSRLLLLFISI